MLSKEAISQLTDAIWERLAGDVATGRGMLKSSVHEALAGWNAVKEFEEAADYFKADSVRGDDRVEPASGGLSWEGCFRTKI